MKFNGSILLNSVLTITLLSFPILPVNAIQKTNYGKDHSIKSHGEVTILVAAGSKEDSNSGSNSLDNNGFVSKRTTGIEFTVALVTIIAGLLISERLQRNQE